MNRRRLVIFCACIIRLSFAESQTEVSTMQDIDTHAISEQQPCLENALAFISVDENHPTGEYSPGVITDIANSHSKQTINTAYAYVGGISYSDVVEEKHVGRNESMTYLGYFINAMDETIYLYGTKDIMTPNDAQDDDNDTDDDDQDFDEEE